VHRRYADSDANCAFVSNLEDLILATHPVLWVHGHVHDPFDYMVGETRVLANPRGYPNEQIQSRAEKRHDPVLLLDI
jgi:Icc-related predicted phosphoesterase